jgi:hypothetical protein
VAMAEGTVGRNAEMNGLMDMTAASGTGLSVFTGASSVAGVSNAQIPYGWTFSGPNLSAAISAGTATASVSSGTSADGFPTITVDWEGLISSAPQFQFVNAAANSGARLTAGDHYMGGARISYANHPTNGGLYGASGCENKAQLQSAAVIRNSPSGPQSVTLLAERVVAGSTAVGTNLYCDSSLIADWGGPLDLYHVAPLIDTSGCTFLTLNHTLTVTGTSGVPFAGRYVFGQTQVRRRNDAT